MNPKLKKALQYIITAAIGIVLAIIIMFARYQIHTAPDVKTAMQALSDSFFVPGVCIAGVGLLIFASNGGVFDMLAYAVRWFFVRFKRDINARKYKDYYEYREAKKEEKRSFAFMLIVGLAFIALAGIFIIVYYNV